MSAYFVKNLDSILHLENYLKFISNLTLILIRSILKIILINFLQNPKYFIKLAAHLLTNG
jgi:hypothetical protein